MSSLARLGRALVQPLKRAGQAYNETAKKYPMSTGVVTTVVKTSAADAFAQFVSELGFSYNSTKESRYMIVVKTCVGC